MTGGVTNGGAAGGARAVAMEQQFARAAIVLGVAAVVSAVFVLTPALPEYIDLVDVSPAVAGVSVVLGAIAIIGGVRRSVLTCALAGVGFLLAAAAQLVQIATGIPILGGDASALALFGAWGVGLLSVCWADRDTPLPTTPTPEKDG